MSQIISRPIYVQPTYTLHCNRVPAQQGGWTGKTSLESITDLSISCGALGFIWRMDSELKYAPPARQGICHSRPLSVAPQSIAASDFWPVATIFATGSAISTSSAHITPPCDTVFYKPLADWQCQSMRGFRLLSWLRRQDSNSQIVVFYYFLYQNTWCLVLKL